MTRAEFQQQAQPIMATRHVMPLIGCDELREWLIAQGFRTAHDSLSRDNECNWYAYRRSALPARECECNDGRLMQLLVKPHRFAHHNAPGGAWESVEVEVTGEAGGVWFKLQAYSLKHDELRERLGEIENSLIASWNALLTNKPDAQEQFVTVTFEGVKWCMTGEHKDGEFEPTKIWLACDPRCNDLMDYLKGIVIDDLADLAANK